MERDRQNGRKRNVIAGHPSLLRRLKTDCDAYVTYTPEKGPLEQLRQAFFNEHAATFCRSLRSCLGPFSLQATPLSFEVGEVFRKECQGDPLRAAFHGTDSKNLGSIYEHGLVIPGEGNSVRVQNGSAHGLGVYTAVVENPHLSWSYARGEKPMLVCGVLDSTCEQTVKHTGSAMVIFDSRRVAPLFEARQWPQPKRRQPRVAEQFQYPGRRNRPLCSSLARLVGVAKFLARRSARKRHGPLDFRSGVASQCNC